METKRILPFIILGIVLASTIGVPQNTEAGAFPVVRNVNTGEIFQSIQDAIDDPDTRDGHVIELDPGNYRESVVVTKGVVIRSASGNPEDVIIETSEPGLPVFRITHDDAIIKAVTLTGAKKSGTYALVVGKKTYNCRIINVRVFSSYGGVYLDQGGANHRVTMSYFESVAIPITLNSVSATEVSMNSMKGPDRGVVLLSSTGNSILNNTITNPIYNGILLRDGSAANTVSGNTVSRGQGSGIVLHESHNNTVEANNLTENAHGLEIVGGSKGNIVRDNFITGNELGVYIADTSWNLLYNNYLSNGQNARDTGENYWNTTKREGPNIVGGPYIGGNYWSDYEGSDKDGDGIGDTQVPHTSGGGVRAGDWLPLVKATPGGGLPDLIVTDIWKEGGKLWFQVRNVEGKDSGPFEVALLLNGEPVKTLSVEGLKAGEPFDGSFDLPECRGGVLRVGVWADSGGKVHESDEENNARVEEWKCDEEPPRIVGLKAVEVGRDYAVIFVGTSEESRVKVKYSPDTLPSEVTDDELKEKHVIRLEGLEPGTLYWFMAEVSDGSGNSAVSERAFFKTLPVPDGEKPGVERLTLPITPGKPLRAYIRDNTGIDRVEFYVDGRLMGVDYSPGNLSMMYLTPGILGMAGIGRDAYYTEHEVIVRVCDTSGLCDNVTEIWRPSYEVQSVEVEVVSPPDHYTMSTLQANSTGSIEVSVYAAEYELSIRDCPSSELGQLMCLNSPGELIPHPVDSLTLYVWGPNGYEVKRVFYPHTDNDLTFTYEWDVRNLEPGLYLIAAVANSTNGQSYFSRAVTVEVASPRKEYSFHQEIRRVGNYFNVTLSVRNTGEVPIRLDEITETLKGFQAVVRNGTGYTMTGRYYVEEEHERVTFNFNGTTLEPGEVARASYLAVPLLYPHQVYRGIGVPVVVEVDEHLETFYPSQTVRADESLESMDEAAVNAMGQSDYLIVTNPENLFHINENEDDVQRLLSAMAELAILRNGVIGYIGGGGKARINVKNALIATGDPNGDGKRDIVVYHPDSGKLVVHNLLGGEESAELEKGAGGLALHDLDRDGKDEIILAGEYGFVRVYGKERVTDENGNQKEKYVEETYSPGGRLHGHVDVACGYVYGSTIFEVYPTCAVLDGSQVYLITSNLQEPIQLVSGEHDLGTGRGKRVFFADMGGDRGDSVLVLLSTGELREYYIVSDSLELQGTINVPYSDKNGYATGDIDGDGMDEFVVFDAENNKIEVYTMDGLEEEVPFYFGGAPVKKAKIGDVLPGRGGEVVFPSSDGEWLYFYTWDELQNFEPLSPTLIEEWGNYLKDGWLDHGYLVIVGETEIVPALKTSYDPLWLDWGNTKVIRTTDVPYANTEGDVLDPELIVARFPGYRAGEILKGIENAIAVARGECSFDRSHALILSGWPESRGGGSDYIDFYEHSLAVYRALRDQGAEVRILKSTDYPDEEVNGSKISHRGDVVNAFFNLAPGRDIIHLEGHGNWNVIDDLYASDLSGRTRPFGGTCPFVYAESCLTGDYTKGKSVAEAFLQAGAAVYLGATEEVWSAPWTARAKRLYRKWDSRESIGMALRELKREMGGWELEDEMDMVWVLEMHLYGDPKLGLGVSTPEERANSGAPKSLDLQTPDYSIERTDEGDVMGIEGGSYVEVPGNPLLPYYTYTLIVPAGSRVADVRLVGKEVAERVPLNPVIARIGKLGGNVTYNTTTVNLTLPDYRWRIIENPDGSTTLVIKVFPVRYNELTGEATIYRSHRFEISYVETGVRLESLVLSGERIKRGDTLKAGLILTNTGRDDVVLTARIRRVSNNSVAFEAPARLLEGFGGVGRFSTEFGTEGLEEGEYYVEMEARDTEGHVLDRKTAYFSVGFAELVVSLYPEGEPSPGEEFTAVMEITNVGDLPAIGSAHITSPEGNELVRNVTVMPGQRITIEGTFTAGKEWANLTGYVLYDGRMSKPAYFSIPFAKPEEEKPAETTTAPSSSPSPTSSSTTSPEESPATTTETPGPTIPRGIVGIAALVLGAIILFAILLKRR
ncbi:NosD domain-containing protein [Palaeococcus ferrophilus]|uniref:NosD domain-containing protein n=1 Tax=Palaeococcus ferrophilus TaxID=83868 RepID=UPI00064E38C7|nr:NosD domain-containing protein [Palaeococcus ferrophilus]